MNTPTSLAVEKTKSKLLPYVVLTIGIGLWGIAYSYLESLTRTLVNLLDLPNGPAKESIQFFVYDTPKVFMLLALIVFLMGIVRSYFSPERTRAILAGKNEGLGNIAAAGLGIVTPFCTCSAVPMFIGFLSAGVPLGVTFSFLIAAPMINEIALGLLFGLVGWKVAAAYLVFGLTIAIISGWIIGKLHLEHWLEPWIRSRSKSENAQTIATFADRIKAGTNAAKEIVGQVWLWVMAGIAIGALIHGYVPTELMATIMGNRPGGQSRQPY